MGPQPARWAGLDPLRRPRGSAIFPRTWVAKARASALVAGRAAGVSESDRRARTWWATAGQTVAGAAEPVDTVPRSARCSRRLAERHGRDGQSALQAVSRQDAGRSDARLMTNPRLLILDEATEGASRR